MFRELWLEILAHPFVAVSAVLAYLALILLYEVLMVVVRIFRKPTLEDVICFLEECAVKKIQKFHFGTHTDFIDEVHNVAYVRYIEDREGRMRALTMDDLRVDFEEKQTGMAVTSYVWKNKRYPVPSSWKKKKDMRKLFIYIRGIPEE
jgi:hypothetical protein